MGLRAHYRSMWRIKLVLIRLIIRAWGPNYSKPSGPKGPSLLWSGTCYYDAQHHIITLLPCKAIGPCGPSLALSWGPVNDKIVLVFDKYFYIQIKQ